MRGLLQGQKTQGRLLLSPEGHSKLETIIVDSTMARPSVAVVVIGDIGRSPRMQVCTIGKEMIGRRNGGMTDSEQ